MHSTSVNKQFSKLNLKLWFSKISVTLYKETDAREAQFLIPFSKQSQQGLSKGSCQHCAKEIFYFCAIPSLPPSPSSGFYLQCLQHAWLHLKIFIVTFGPFLSASLFQSNLKWVGTRASACGPAAPGERPPGPGIAWCRDGGTSAWIGKTIYFWMPSRGLHANAH